jgi:hypothetical protein
MVQIRKLLDYLNDMNQSSFSDVQKAKELTYTSPTSKEGGEPIVYEGSEASAILGNWLMAVDTLEWVLEESMAVRPAVNEEELQYYKGRVLYDGDNRPMISDCSKETFIARLEGEW